MLPTHAHKCVQVHFIAVKKIKHTAFILFFAMHACFAISCFNDNDSQLKIYIEKGQALYDNGSYHDAIRLWKKAIELSPDDHRLHFFLAKTYQQLSQFDVSTRHLKQVISKKSDDADAYFMMIQNELFAGHFESAKQISSEFEKLSSDKFKMTMLKGDISTFLGKYEEAEDHYRKVIRMDSHKSETYFKLAAILLVQGKEKPADNLSRMAIKLDDQSSTHYWLHRAAYQSIKGDSKKAEFALRQALQDQPNSYFLKTKIAQLLLTYRKYNALIDFLESNPSTLAESTILRKLYVEALLNTRQLNKAHEILKSHEKANDPEWLLLSGKKYLLQSSFSMASGYFERVIELRKNDPRASYMLAVAYLAADKISLATSTLVRLLAEYPEMVEAELALATIYYKKEEYDLSIDYLKRVIEKAPENPRPYIMLGNCMLSSGQHDAAESNFKMALLWDSNSIAARYYLALAKEKTGQRDEAIQLLRSIFSKATAKADVGLRLANLLIKEGRADEAVDLFKPLVSSQPENGYHKLILGNIYRASHRYDIAAYYYRLAVEVSPNLVEGYINLADLQPDNAKKIVIIEDAMKKAPDSIDLLFFSANIYFSDNQLDLAISAMSEAYRIDPQNPSVANNLAWLYLETETKLNDAYELAISAFEKDPDNPSYAHTLGWALHKKGLIRKAEWQFRESIRLIEKNDHRSGNNPLKAICSYHLALTLLKAENEFEAKEKLSFAINTGLPSRYEKHALEILGTLQGPNGLTSDQAGAEADPTF
jgi:tetratricopeptide (TPR) repeat protein